MAARELVCYCFEMRSAAHLAHLNTDSYSVHKALEEFYEGIVPLADQFAEVWMGLHERKVGIAPTLYKPDPASPVKALERFLQWLDDDREECTEEDVTLENIYAEIRGLTARALYKLNTLA